MSFDKQPFRFEYTDYDPNAMIRKARMYAIGAIAVVVIVWTGVVGSQSLAPDVPSPLAYTTYTAPDNWYKINVPSDWRFTNEDSGWEGQHSAMFSVKGAQILVTENRDVSGSSATTNTSGSDDAGNPDTTIQRDDKLVDAMSKLVGIKPSLRDPNQTPLHQEHEFLRLGFDVDYGILNEADPVGINLALGTGCYSEFTIAPNPSYLPSIRHSGRKPVGFPWYTHGYRATFLTPSREINIFCIGDERSWKELKPAFMHVIDSIAPG